MIPLIDKVERSNFDNVYINALHDDKKRPRSFNYDYELIYELQPYDENFADLSKCTINLDHVLKVLDSSEIPFTFGTKTNRALFETVLIVQGSYNDSIQQ